MRQHSQSSKVRAPFLPRREPYNRAGIEAPCQIVLQEGAPVSDANAMKRSMYSVAFLGHHNPCWMDCFKALPTCLCSIF